MENTKETARHSFPSCRSNLASVMSCVIFLHEAVFSSSSLLLKWELNKFRHTSWLFQCPCLFPLAMCSSRGSKAEKNQLNRKEELQMTQSAAATHMPSFHFIDLPILLFLGDLFIDMKTSICDRKDILVLLLLDYYYYYCYL